MSGEQLSAMMEGRKIRNGVDTVWITIAPSCTETSGVNSPLFQNLKLSTAESAALGLPILGDTSPSIDLLLLDFPPEIESHRKLWLALITNDELDSDVSADVYRGIRESVIPTLANDEVLQTGVHVNGQRLNELKASPRNIFLNWYLRGVMQGKRPLIIIVHGGYGAGGFDKAIGTYSGRICEYAYHIYRQLPLGNYSVLLDATCADLENPLPAGDLQYGCPVIFPAGEVIFHGGTPNELQSSCIVIESGKVTTFSWLEILKGRRGSGKLLSLNSD